MTELNNTLYRLNKNIHLFTQDETIQILDFQQGQFYALDAIAAQMLTLVLEQGFEEADTHITQNHETTREQITDDLSRLLFPVKQRLIISSRKTEYFLTFTQLTEVIHSVAIGFLQAIALGFRKIYNPSQNPDQIIVNLLLSLSWLSFRYLKI